VSRADPGADPEVTPGLVVVDKPGGMTSHDVVARVRRLAGTRKVGHAGTLDPMATGVLLVGVGRATRLLGHLQLTDKSYDATIRLGAATTTDDAEGELLAQSPAAHLDEDVVRSALAGFVGEVDQVPSSVSAIKVDGRRAYDRVRAGEQVELAARRVRIDRIDVHGLTREGDFTDVAVSVHCSTGTYVRSIARDLGDLLGVGGHLTRLRRTAVGAFGLDRANTLDQLAERYEQLPLEEVARASFPTYDLDEQQATDVGFGRKLPLDLGAPSAEAPVALFAPDGSFLALYEQQGELARAVAVFTS
jgi:tRNA pseudouridine55 synthase